MMRGIGPVLALTDVAGWKVMAFVPLTELPDPNGVSVNPRFPRQSPGGAAT